MASSTSLLPHLLAAPASRSPQPLHPSSASRRHLRYSPAIRPLRASRRRHPDAVVVAPDARPWVSDLSGAGPSYRDGGEEDDDDGEEEEDNDRSLDLLVRFLQSLFKKASRRARRAARSVLPPSVPAELVKFSVNGVLVLTSLWIMKGLLEKDPHIWTVFRIVTGRCVSDNCLSDMQQSVPLALFLRVHCKANEKSNGGVGEITSVVPMLGAPIKRLARCSSEGLAIETATRDLSPRGRRVCPGKAARPTWSELGLISSEYSTSRRRHGSGPPVGTVPHVRVASAQPQNKKLAFMLLRLTRIVSDSASSSTRACVAATAYTGK
ncbi:hypothetical protein PR202_gb19121 [Eleusine coracana subsp. coracana]|uniref:Uncharacterized protein n=1 Tax=Eleusine coracana subsp. coracana TaxID=191504 RepID=A0AAV5F7E1_ELECO|nr:hypothetical protein PR202_gb19121 [Eleusine coracana subsp. coracana]